jgi:hypothetical protein
MGDALKQIAWNGMQLMVPVDWQIARLGLSHVSLERDGQPVLEIKWGKPRGAFSAQWHLRQLARQNGLSLGKALVPETPRPGWQEALYGYQVSGFSWQKQGINGKGVIVDCPVCRTVTLIQFLFAGAFPADRLVASILSSFRDHRQDQHRLWAIYDIQALLPESFCLVRHQVVSGAFQLNFSGPQATRLSLYRFAPASVLLAQTTLAEFARSRLAPGPGLEPVTCRTKDGCLDFSLPVQAGLWQRIKDWQSGPAVECRVRVWHLPQHNRLLAVHLEAGKDRLNDLMERICAAYGCV